MNVENKSGCTMFSSWLITIIYYYCNFIISDLIIYKTKQKRNRRRFKKDDERSPRATSESREGKADDKYIKNFVCDLYSNNHARMGQEIFT